MSTPLELTICLMRHTEQRESMMNDSINILPIEGYSNDTRMKHNVISNGVWHRRDPSHKREARGAAPSL